MIGLIKNNKYFLKNSPQMTRNLWHSLDKSNYQRNKRKFIRKLFTKNKEIFGSEEELKIVINSALDEKLVAEEEDPKLGYRLIPSADRKRFSGDISDNKTKDRYCFVCHSCDPNQELIPCLNCFRSYHKPCLESIESKTDSKSDAKCDSKSGSSDDSNTNTEVLNSFETVFTCDYCHRITSPKSVVDKQCGQPLKQLIKTFLTKLENSLVNIDIYKEYRIESDLNSYALLISPLNLDIIRLKAFKLKNYQSFAEFESDLRHFCHNFSIVRDQNMIKTFSDCIDYELTDLSDCIDCYLWSRGTGEAQIPPDKWFTRVCRRPHHLVFAKYMAYPYWPSKVIKQDSNSNQCLVQFFEPKTFSKAWVPNDKIRSIGYRFESKQLTSDKILPSMALLFKYLKNLQEESSSDPDLFFRYPIYENPFRRFEKLLTKKWGKTKNPVLAELNLEVNRSGDNSSKKSSKRKYDSIEDSFGIQSLRIDNNSQSSGESSDGQMVTDLVPKSKGKDTPLSRILCKSEVTEEHKMQICSLILRSYSQQIKSK